MLNIIARPTFNMVTTKTLIRLNKTKMRFGKLSEYIAKETFE